MADIKTEELKEAIAFHTGGRVLKAHKEIDPRTGQEIIVIDQMEGYTVTSEPRLKAPVGNQQRRPQ